MRSLFVHDMGMFEADTSHLQPGQLLARGVSRHLRDLGLASVLELVPTRGLRVDVMALTAKGEIWVVECKSCRADFMGDHKWQGYLEWCDRFFWAVDAEFPQDLLPDESGLILADSYSAEIVRDAPLTKLAAARRAAVTRLFARHAALRLQRQIDPRP